MIKKICMITLFLVFFLINPLFAKQMEFENSNYIAEWNFKDDFKGDINEPPLLHFNFNKTYYLFLYVQNHIDEDLLFSISSWACFLASLIFFSLCFFNYSSVCLKETNKYTLCPNIEKMSMDTYLKEKAYYNNKHYFSDFNMRTIWTYDIKNEEIEEFEYEEEVYYLVRIIGIVSIYAPNDKMLTRIEDFKFNYLKNYKYSKRYIELLMQNACNGIYQTARDIDEMYKELYSSANHSLPVWCCDTCMEVFVNLDEFFYHLIEEGHMDGVFNEHPFDNEVKRVKNLVENKIKNKET